MYIRCPQCGRRGRLPDEWVPEAHSLRCRRCGAMFKTPKLERVSAERAVGPNFDPIAKLGRDQPASFVADGFFSAFDDETLSPRVPGPGDSNYEVTFTLQDAEGDSDPEWDVKDEGIDSSPEAPSSDEIPSLQSPAAATDTWPQRFVEAWGPRLIISAVALIGALIPTIAYLIWETIRAGSNLHVPAPALIAGCACAIGLLMIAVPLILLATALTQLVHEVRRLSPQAERQGEFGRR